MATVSIKAPRFDWITGLDIKLMMALMSSGALKVSAKLYVECYTVFWFDISLIESSNKEWDTGDFTIECLNSQ